MRASWPLLVVALSACHKVPPAVSASIEVRMDMPNRSSGELQSSVTAVLERACSQVAHVARARGVTQDGLSRVTVQLEAGASLDAAISEIQLSLRKAQPSLPPSGGPLTVTAAPGAVVARYTWSSDVVPAVDIDAILQSKVDARLSRTTGVARVSVCDWAAKQVVVEIDPQALAGTALTITDVVTALGTLAPAAPGGVTTFSKVVLGVANGAPIRLGDVATVRDDGGRRGCLAFDEHGLVEEEIVYASVATNKDALRGGMGDLPAGVDHRTLYATREITIDLVPDLAFRALAGLRDAVMQVPGVGHFVIELGDPGDAAGVAPSVARILLAPTNDELVARLLAALRQVAIVRSAGEANATVELVGADRAALNAASAAFFQRLAERGELVARLGVAETSALTTTTDGESVRKLGIEPRDVELALSVMRGRSVTPYLVGDRSVPVVVRVRGSLDEPGSLDRVYVRSASGASVSLSAIVRQSSDRVAPTLLDEGGLPMVGARVHTTDLVGLPHAFEPPAGVTVRVFPD